MLFVIFFFFKQKTAYEMRISDWSSDVCSSDLADLDDLALDGEVFQHGFEQSRIALKADFVERGIGGRRGRIEQIQRREGVAVAQRQRRLPFALRPAAAIGCLGPVGDHGSRRFRRSKYRRPSPADDGAVRTAERREGKGG